MKRAALVVLCAVACTACTGLGGKAEREEGRRIGTGLVVEFALADREVNDKVGIEGVSNKGGQLFAASMRLRGKVGRSVSHFVGGRLPKTVRVTWRTDTEPGRDFTTGRVIGDHLVEVDRLVPEEVIRYANAGPGRALRLLFRIKDDGVLFGWDVQETVYNPPRGSGLVYSMRGGEVPCNEIPRLPNVLPNCTEGPLEDASWFNPKWIRGKRPANQM